MGTAPNPTAVVGKAPALKMPTPEEMAKPGKMGCNIASGVLLALVMVGAYSYCVNSVNNLDKPDLPAWRQNMDAGIKEGEKIIRQRQGR